MIILFQNILSLKQFVAWNGCFRLFTKTRKWSRTSFWCTFSASFFHKNVPYLILYQLTKFNVISFFLLKQNALVSSYLDHCRPHKLQHLSSIILLANGWQAKKEGKTETQKFEYLDNQKSYLDEIKSIFRKYLRAVIWGKKKK